jgi:hypothetical protein
MVTGNQPSLNPNANTSQAHGNSGHALSPLGGPAPGSPPMGASHNSASSVAGHINPSSTIYWCIVKSFVEPMRTFIGKIDASKEKFDSILLRRLSDEYNSTRGWRGRLLSWKSCQDVSFVKVRMRCCGREPIGLSELVLTRRSSLLYTKANKK